MDFFNKIIEQLKEIFGKLDTTKKIIIGSVAGVVLIAFIVLFSVSTSKPDVLLFSNLPADEFGKVTKKMEEMGMPFTTSGTTDIFVKPESRELYMTKLAQEKMIPRGVPGWQLFDVSKWTETDKEIDIKFMRALRGAIKKHIESLKNIEKADIEIAKSEEDLYSGKTGRYTAAVTLYKAPGYDKLSRKVIEGIKYLVSRAVGTKLNPKDVIVTDEEGKMLSDFDDDYDKVEMEAKLLEKRRIFREKERLRILKDIKNGLETIFTPDRIQIVRLNLQFNWDKVKSEKKEHTPIIKRKDDPKTPYSEEEVQDSLIISEKKVKEKFQGHGFNPEGPQGTESNKPPGYKASDDQYAKYEKNEEIKNHGINVEETKSVRQPFTIDGVSVAIVIDGIQDLPKKPDGTYDLDMSKKPSQLPVSKEDLKNAEDIVKKAINFNEIRGDQVSVKNIFFDKTKEWQRIRDEHIRKEQMKKMLLATLVGVFALFLGVILFRAISKELARRRRIREENLAAEQQRMREAALRAAEEEAVDVELSLEEKARLELQENAINLVRERPDDVAQLLRTWLAEE